MSSLLDAMRNAMVLFVAGVSMSVILPFESVAVNREGKSCGRVVDNSAVDLRGVLHTHLAQTVELDASRFQLREESTLALEELRHLALNLARFLQHQLLQHLLTQHGDRHDRTGATTTLVGGDLVRSVVALVAHAIIIASVATVATPSDAKSQKISKKIVTLEHLSTYGRLGYLLTIVDNLWKILT